MTYAHVLRSGELKFSRSPTFEGLIVSEGSGKEWKQGVEVLCRLSYDGTFYLVPGVPEAENEIEALNAVNRFKASLEYRALPKSKRNKISWGDYVDSKMKSLKYRAA